MVDPGFSKSFIIFDFFSQYKGKELKKAVSKLSDSERDFLEVVAKQFRNPEINAYATPEFKQKFREIKEKLQDKTYNPPHDSPITNLIKIIFGQRIAATSLSKTLEIKKISQDQLPGVLKALATLREERNPDDGLIDVAAFLKSHGYSSELDHLDFAKAHRAIWGSLPKDNLRGLNLSNLKFNRCNFDGMDMRHCRFTNCSLTKCSMNKSSLFNCHIENSIFNSCDLYQINAKKAVVKNAKFEKSIIRNGDFQQAVLTNVTFSRTNLKNTHFEKRDIHNTEIMDNKTSLIDHLNEEGLFI